VLTESRTCSISIYQQTRPLVKLQLPSTLVLEVIISVEALHL